MSHVVLLGDSILDNADYVPDGLTVIDQLRALLPQNWSATLLAVDGDVTADVLTQLEKLPQSATHLVISCGGNDALGYLEWLSDPARSVAEAFELFARVRGDFRKEYRRMLERVAGTNLDITVCTIYDCVPDLEPAARTALALFNEIILREAVAARVAVIDLRLVCSEGSDYSKLSSIEPSEQGGAKIAKVIGQTLLDRPKSSVTIVYS